MDNTIYELPDKNNIVIGKEASEIPEKLFGCKEVGLQVCRNKRYDFEIL